MTTGRINQVSLVESWTRLSSIPRYHAQHTRHQASSNKHSRTTPCSNTSGARYLCTDTYWLLILTHTNIESFTSFQQGLHLSLFIETFHVHSHSSLDSTSESFTGYPHLYFIQRNLRFYHIHSVLAIYMVSAILPSRLHSTRLRSSLWQPKAC